MSEMGKQLREARDSRGVSLRQVAAATKISVSVLECLERGEFKHLPGGIFSRAFVRSYAIEVGLDPDDVVAQFVVELAAAVPDERETVRPDVTAADLVFLERQRKARVILRVALVVIAAAVVVAFVVWRLSRVT